MCDISVMFYVRKAMMQAKMSLNKDSVWSEAWLTYDLQCIVLRQRNRFNGKMTRGKDCETEIDSNL